MAKRLIIGSCLELSNTCTSSLAQLKWRYLISSHNIGEQLIFLVIKVFFLFPTEDLLNIVLVEFILIRNRRPTCYITVSFSLRPSSVAKRFRSTLLENPWLAKITEDRLVFLLGLSIIITRL